MGAGDGTGEESDGRNGRASARDNADCDCKVGRSATAFGVSGLDAELLRRREGGASLRALERVVNEALLERALASADTDVLGDVSSIYGTLSGERGSAGDRTELRDRLERAGVDVDALEDAFVSHVTVRSHLRDCLDVDTDRSSALSRDDAIGTIEWARSRSEGIVERTLERLADGDDLAAGDLEITQVVRVRCRDCGASAPVAAFVDGGGCDCSGGGDGQPGA